MKYPNKYQRKNKKTAPTFPGRCCPNLINEPWKIQFPIIYYSPATLLPWRRASVLLFDNEIPPEHIISYGRPASLLLKTTQRGQSLLCSFCCFSSSSPVSEALSCACGASFSCSVRRSSRRLFGSWSLLPASAPCQPLSGRQAGPLPRRPYWSSRATRLPGCIRLSCRRLRIFFTKT